MEDNLPSRKVNIFSSVGFIVSLLPTLGIVLVLFLQNKTGPTAFESFLSTFLFQLYLVYACIGIVLAVISLVITRKSNEQGSRALAYMTIIISVVTIVIAHNLFAWQENQLRSYELEQQRQIQDALQNKR